MDAAGLEGWPQAVALVAAAIMGVTTWLVSGRRGKDGRPDDDDDVVSELIRENERLQTNTAILRVKEDVGTVIQAVREAVFMKIAQVETEINRRLSAIELSNARIEQMLRYGHTTDQDK